VFEALLEHVRCPARAGATSTVAGAYGVYRMLNADYAGAAKLAVWKKRVRTGWPNVGSSTSSSRAGTRPRSARC
jgi:hypothetical protein